MPQVHRHPHAPRVAFCRDPHPIAAPKRRRALPLLRHAAGYLFWRAARECFGFSVSGSHEQVYATILYYLHNKEAVEAYLADWLEYCRTSREDFFRNPPPVVERLRKPKTAQDQLRTAGL